ncbi:ThuA domain-containing protein [Microbacterium sp. zg.Y1084]|uniref:ThuA domain-containing protein n=1 Tax=Microbacterium sp. zg.Y1084 TaxID=2969667 RepID=UPI00214C9EB7|nr:ThuA domain-containing protein [Microbacterium sp. zg.Y1084]MCR2813947.1 ThuA domain-containing protein [Microbacterium sp. zg.Y1084]
MSPLAHPTAVIASGSGRYADPWHPFPRTSALLADTLRAAGFQVVVDDDVDAAMTRLDDAALLVVNAGDPWRDDASRTNHPPAASVTGLDQALARGIGVLAMHLSVGSLRDYPSWAPAIGGMWIPGASWHPEIADVEITGGTLPDGTPVDGFTVFDERYCRLQQLGERSVVATHVTDGERMPTAWVRTYGAARVAVDTLGHDERSYDSAGHRQLIGTLARWAAGA